MKATENLSDEFIIGSGGFGTIYRAEMRNGEVFAVKKIIFSDDDPLQDKSFIRELQTLGKIRHRHLVKLIGWCSHQGTNLLVYDYMPNGSLWDRLHGSLAKKLFWEDRLKIAIGMVEGVAYFHHDCVPRIIHRDIKSSNILIDSEGEAHVGDFGLAKFVDASNSTYSTSLFAGSYGYIAPEYAYSMRATEKSDVYSVGVVLMELVTGKMPTDESFPEGMNIVNWVESYFSEDSYEREVLDSRLRPHTPSEEAEMFLVLKIALDCTKTSYTERPTMREVADKLSHVCRENTTSKKRESEMNRSLCYFGTLSVNSPSKTLIGLLMSAHAFTVSK